MVTVTSSNLSASLLKQLYSSSINSNSSSAQTEKGLSQTLQASNQSADQFGLSQDAQQKVWFVRSQLEVNYRVFQSLNSSDGTTTTQETLSFKETLEFLQNASGQTSEAQSGESAPADEVTAPEATGTQAQDHLSQLLEYFSPEKTAGRILDVAMSFFPASETAQTEGNTEASRRKFADFIGNAIEQGFSQAKGILGALPDEVSAGIEKTHSLVFSGLEDFVQNGIAPEKLQNGGVMDKIAAYREEGIQKAEQVKKAFSSSGYNAKGESQETQPSSGKISTTG